MAQTAIAFKVNVFVEYVLNLVKRKNLDTILLERNKKVTFHFKRLYALFVPILGVHKSFIDPFKSKSTKSPVKLKANLKKLQQAKRNNAKNFVKTLNLQEKKEMKNHCISMENSDFKIFFGPKAKASTDQQNS